MDADRFDTLARSLSVPRSRRAALSGAAAGGFLSALGLTRSVPEARAAQGGACVVTFAAQLLQGPSTQQALTPGGGRAGEVRGELSFSLLTSGKLDNAALMLADGTNLPVVGQAMGHSLQLRIALGPQRALVAVGVGELEISRCQGAIDGVATGPQRGDLGDWHAAGVQQARGGQGGADAATQGSAAGAASGAAGAGTEPAGRSGRAGNTGRATTGSSSVGQMVDPAQAGTQGTGSGAPAPSCPGGETYCAYVEECRNLRTSPLDCGACGTRCPSLVCQEGRCLSEEEADRAGATALNCGPGEAFCANEGGYCADLQTDPLNCGQCGLPCASELGAGTCIDGTCACSPGTTRCDDACVDTKTDPDNCGACGNACAAGATCVGGACAPEATGGGACPDGQVRCGDACQDALPNFGSDGLSCPGGGAPPTECPAGRVLCNGACFPEGACQPTECPPGWGYCYGVCRDFQNDPGYCGGCSTGCTGGAYCAAGTCVSCPEGQTPCGATCVDTRIDLNNCGFCGNLCGTQCIDGQCTGVGPAPTVTCPAGQTRCGDACVDLTRDSANCGRCGVVCSTPTYCAPTGNGTPPGICFIPAEVCFAQGMTTCGEYCSDTENDPNNCGGCYSKCGAGSECQGGLCTVPSASFNPATLVGEESPAISCPEGQVDCSGVCTDISFDPFNCGGCGVACGPDSLCDFGVCGEAPVATAPEAEDTTCVAAGGACDPASPGACCSGACNDDGACA